MALELTEEQVKAGWTVQKLGDLGEIFDGPHATAKKIESGPYYLSISSLVDGRLALAESAHISEEDFSKWTKRVTPVYPDLLFSYETKLGSAALMPKGVRASLGRRMGLIRFDTQKVNPHFMLYKWLSPEFQRYIQQHKISGATVERIALSELGKWEVALPPKPDQDRIAEILGSLDDKIEANKALNTNLRELFKLRFSSLVKESSREVMLTDMAEFINGKAFTKGASGTGRMVIRIAELNGGPGASTVYNEIDVDSKHEANPGDILMSWSGSLGVFLWSREQAIINQHIFKVVPKPGFSKAVIFCALENVIDDFRSIALEKATTMGHIKRGDLERTVRIPTYNAELEVVLNQICVLEQENLALVDTRDLLIRKLIK